VQFLIVIVILLVVMWFLLIRPQRRKQLEQQRMLDRLAPGEEVLTAGGVYGTVRSIADDVVSLEIAPGTEIRVAKRAIAAVISEPVGEPRKLEEAGEGEEVGARERDRWGDPWGNRPG